MEHEHNEDCETIMKMAVEHTILTGAVHKLLAMSGQSQIVMMPEDYTNKATGTTHRHLSIEVRPDGAAKVSASVVNLSGVNLS
jgi:hypothetical protein